jgi:transposase-like protein
MEINKKYLFPERKKILQQLGPNPTEEQLQSSAKLYGIQLETLQKWVRQYEKMNSSDEEMVTKLLNE